MYVLLLLVGQGSEWASDATWFPYCGSLAVSFIVLFMVVRFYGMKAFEGKVWLLIFIGLALWTLAEFISGIDVLLGALDAGSMPAILTDNADYPFLAGYIVMAIGFFYKAKNTPSKPNLSKAFVLYSLIGTLMIISAFTVILPLLNTTLYSGSEKFFLLAYLAMDIILFGIALAIALYWGTQVSVGWHIISAGLLSMMIADIGYTAMDLHGIYFDGSLIELAWVWAYILIGLAGHYQRKLHESLM
jgi:hypothetical protein